MMKILILILAVAVAVIGCAEDRLDTHEMALETERACAYFEEPLLQAACAEIDWQGNEPDVAALSSWCRIGGWGIPELGNIQQCCVIDDDGYLTGIADFGCCCVGPVKNGNWSRECACGVRLAW